MDLDPDDQQLALMEMVERFATDRFPSERVRDFADRFDWRYGCG